MTLDPKTFAALVALDEKWARNCEETNPWGVTMWGQDCPLCHLFIPELNPDYKGLACDGCPIAAKTGERYCMNTPWSNAQYAILKWRRGDITRDEALPAIHAMHRFLVKLRKEHEVAE